MSQQYEGTLLKGSRFLIGNFIDSGNYGRVYEISDNLFPSKKFVIKICTGNEELFKKERKLMVKISEIQGYGAMPSTGAPYFIMPRYGQNLWNYFYNNSKQMSKFSVLAIGRAMLDALENIHSFGYTYNDLKADNILIGFEQKIGEDKTQNVFKNVKLHLLDFGFAQSFIKNGRHTTRSETNIFRGNSVFASINQMQFRVTSRRDDLQSLVYLLAYFLKEGVFLDFDFEKLQSESELDVFNKTKASKQKMTNEEICSGRAKCILEFANEVSKIKFAQKPDYEKLRNMLIDIIDIEQIPEETEHNESRNFTINENKF